MVNPEQLEALLLHVDHTLVPCECSLNAMDYAVHTLLLRVRELREFCNEILKEVKDEQRVAGDSDGVVGGAE